MCTAVGLWIPPIVAAMFLAAATEGHAQPEHTQIQPRDKKVSSAAASSTLTTGMHAHTGRRKPLAAAFKFLHLVLDASLH